MPAYDALGRPPITPAVRTDLRDAFEGLTGRGALIVIADEQGARATLAAKLGEHWQVAAGAGVAWGGPVTAQVMIVGRW